MWWIRRNKKGLIIIAVIIILVIVMTLSYLNKDINKIEGKAGSVVTFFQVPLVKVGNALNENVFSIFRFKQLIQENQALSEENAELKQTIIDMKLDRAETESIERLQDAINYYDLEGNYDYITTKIIAYDGSNWFNKFTIHIRKEDNIERGSAVINGDGLVGRIKDIGDNWASVVTVVDDSHSVSFKVLRNQNFIGLVSGNNQGKLEGYLIDPEADVLIGDEIVTSGLGLFKEGIAIGTIEEVIKDENHLLKTVIVEPHVNFKSLDRVIVIKKGI
ncbi:MAG: rod shape-determining protein MreC [Peptostreptococcales bacterium]